jgi:hypothetical protein
MGRSGPTPGRQGDRPRPQPARRPRPPKGPSRIAPKEPVSGKKRRQMLKAAAWRLAALAHVRPAAVLTADVATLKTMIDRIIDSPVPGKHPGTACRLAAKIVRLRMS